MKKTKEPPPSAEDLSAAMGVLARYRWSKKTKTERSEQMRALVNKRWAKRKDKK